LVASHGAGVPFGEADFTIDHREVFGGRHAKVQPYARNLKLAISFRKNDSLPGMGSWSFLSSHGRVLLFLARDPRLRLRDIAARVGITERSAYGIVSDLTAAGYITKQKDGRRNRYQIQAHLPLPEPTSRERTVGEVLALLTSAPVGQPPAERRRG
jgi:DNA-binding transcriptional ArsR family regulator